MTPNESSAQEESVGQRVAKYRKLAKMSAQKLADSAGLTRSVVTNIENGRRDDLTVKELIAISSALRVPPVAIVFPADRPFSAAPTFVEDADNFLPPRTIDLIDWFGASENSRSPSALRDFNEALNELDAVVVYPIGITVWAPESDAGRSARALINSARSLDSAQQFSEEARRKVLLFARDVWQAPTSELFDQLIAAMDAGPVVGTNIGEQLLDSVSQTDRAAVSNLLREADAAGKNERDAREQFQRLGGNPEKGPTMGPLEIMGIVKSMPHERRSITKKRGRLSDGVVENPLREHRFDEFEKLRESLKLPPLSEDDEL